MKDNKLECDVVEVPTTKEMNDKDILNDVLLSLKTIGNNYSVMVSEMSNKVLYKEILNVYIDIKDSARDCFDLVFSKGWYSLKTANEQEIENIIKKMSKLKKEL